MDVIVTHGDRRRLDKPLAAGWPEMLTYITRYPACALLFCELPSFPYSNAPLPNIPNMLFCRLRVSSTATIVWVGIWIWSYMYIMSAGSVGATEVRKEGKTLPFALLILASANTSYSLLWIICNSIERPLHF